MERLITLQGTACNCSALPVCDHAPLQVTHSHPHRVSHAIRVCRASLVVVSDRCDSAQRPPAINRIQALRQSIACLPAIDSDIRNYAPDTRKKRTQLANYNRLHRYRIGPRTCSWSLAKYWMMSDFKVQRKTSTNNSSAVCKFSSKFEHQVSAVVFTTYYYSRTISVLDK